ncbi:MAG: hypothetical protein R2778_10065 [Saprospiraceae bacterium]
MSEHFKDLARERYGTLEGFIKRLDNLSNKMFALAFALAMVLQALESFTWWRFPSLFH